MDKYTSYPNPSPGKVYINLNGEENSTVQLVNLLGKVAYTANYKIGKQLVNLDCSKLKKGTYMLNILKGSERVHQQALVFI